jgi:colanic acid biosynthesis glycosyl transferase WcaI
MLTLLYSGNLGIGQDLSAVLYAVARLNGDGNLRILIVGGGKNLPTVKQLAGQLRLSQIEFRRPVPLYSLPELLAEGDIHVVCQKPGTEGLLVPSKIYSTLAAGRPILFVGPPHCEVARIVCDSQSGIVVEPGDLEGTMDALLTLQRSATVRRQMGVRAREYYEALFGKKQSILRLVDILEAVADSRNGRRVHKRLPRLDIARISE